MKDYKAVPPWVPIDIPRELFSDQVSLVKALDPEGSARYAKRPATWCNIFVWDYTRNAGCEVPHWVDSEGGSTAVGHGRELNANGIVAWLEERWFQATKAEAVEAVKAGRTCVVGWRNPDGTGHVAILLESGEVAQAGVRNCESIAIGLAFGRREVQFFVSPERAAFAANTTQAD